MEHADVTIIGAGVIGLAVAAEMSGKGKEIIVVERHEGFGRESSSRNSEVIHAGIYYPQGSLKALMCVEGREMLYRLCLQEEIPFGKIGKIIVAVDKAHLPVLEELQKKGEANGVKGLRLLSPGEVNELEPRVRAEGGLWSPETGIIDSHSLMAHWERKASADTTFAYNCELLSLEKKGGNFLVVIRDADGDNYHFASQVVINSAGLGAERIASMLGMDTSAAGYTIYPCKGEYFRVAGRYATLLKHLVYPPPTEISVGVHTVLDLQGSLKLGPNAFYVDKVDYNVDENHRGEFFRDVKSYLPFIKVEDLAPDMAGIRPKLYREGEAVRDFIICHEERRGLSGLINLIGIESPGLTASPSIGKYVANIVDGIL